MNRGMETAEPLKAFRDQLYACLGRRADALFELTDAILTAGTVASPPHLSLTPIYRRGWGSLYAALSKGRVDAEALRDLLGGQQLADDPDRARVYAVDRSSWPRCDAECSPDRGYYYHPSRHSAGQPIVAGWSYQVVAEIGFSRDSWVAPADARRVSPEENADLVATGQVRALLGRLPERRLDPLFVFDAGYDPVRLQLELDGHPRPTQILVRLHSDRVFYTDPQTPEKRWVGRPSCHGNRFDLKDSETWTDPDAEHRDQSADYGAVRVRAWANLHPETRRAAERYGSESVAVVRGTVVLVEVERLPSGERRRRPKALWLWWHGRGEPDLDLIWRSYCQRFSIEHAIRHWKQALGWTTLRVRHPEQADRWTWLILAAYAQLLLARGVVADRRLPWEKPLVVEKLTPGRVLRGFVTLVPLLGTPAEAPKPRGRSPGRPKGSFSGRATRYPPVKKAA